MKKLLLFRIFILMAAAAIVFTACDKDEEKEWGDPTIGFTITNADNLDAPADVQFINNSKHGESYHWTFPGGRIVRSGQITNDTVTTAIQPERVHYALPGVYEATLRVTTAGEEKLYLREFTVKKPNVRIEMDPSGGIVYDDTVTFRAVFFEYPGLEDEVTYSWDFGNGETSDEPMPFTTYNPPGEYTVSLTLFDGVETLTTSRIINVQAEIAKTIYFTNAINQSLYKKMLYTGTDLPHEDIGVDVGLHALSVTVHEERIVITVAGENIRFAPADTPADGYIFTTNLNGGNRWTITATGHDHDYRDDPFVGTVGPDGTVYWLDRFQGARSLNYQEQDADYPEPYIFHQAAEGSDLANAIGVSSAFGWTDGAIRIVHGEVWYSKHGTGRGLYRFTTAGDYLGKIEPLFHYKIRTFEVDTHNDKIYFAVNQASGGLDMGLYVCDIDGNNIQLIDPLTDFSGQGGDAERTYVTEMVVDADGGFLYYPFRHQEDINEFGVITGDGSQSGIKRWMLDGSEDPEFYVTGIIPYGIGIDHVKR
ncbi:MAG: PKD domain-containing protein [Bacteroidetes bacterium]|nr:MAG: PKD domain-containing protein [Bacteroidota bacterium]